MVLSKVGDVLMQQRDFAGALAAYRECLDIRDELYAADPDNAGLRQHITVTLDKIGNVLAAQGDHPAAADAHRRAIMIRESPATADPAGVPQNG